MRIDASGRGMAGIALGAFLFAGSPALSAPDAHQIADSLVAASTATGRVKASYESAAAEGETIAIAGFKLVRTDAQTILIPRIVVTGAAPRPTGGFTAERISFDGGKATHGNDVATWTTGLIEEAVVPSADEVKAESDIRPFGKLAVSGITLSESNLKQPVTVADVRVVLQSAAGGATGAFAAQVGGIHFSAEVLKGRPQEKALLDALGYETFDVNIAAAGAFDQASNAMTLNSLTINTAEVGTLTVKAQFSGVSPGKIVASGSDGETRAETMLENIEIRFDNAGVVERALDMHAALIWGTREDAAAQVNAALPLVLHFIGNDAFQAQMATAVGNFLQEPKSLAFSAAPNPPVSLEQILDTALDRPGNLPDLLGADISAN